MGEERKKAVLENYPAVDSLIKDSVYVKLRKDLPAIDRLKVKHAISSMIEDPLLYVVDTIAFSENLKDKMVIIDFFSACTSTVCFILGAFQLIMTLSANIKDSMWELGVLRSMGCTRAQITRVMIYELIANTLSAMTLGYISGVVVSCIAIAQFYTFAELPIRVSLPLYTFVIVGISAFISLVVGAKLGTKVLFLRNIASILKGS